MGITKNPLSVLGDIVDAAKDYAVAGAKQYVAEEAGKIQKDLASSATSDLKSGDQAALSARAKLGGLPVSNKTIYLAGGAAVVIIAALLIARKK